MEKRQLKIIFTKSGAGNITPKLSVPIVWLRELGITPEEPHITLEIQGNEIILKNTEKHIDTNGTL